MWEYDYDTGMWTHRNDNEYVMVTTAGSTRGAWTSTSWTELGSWELDNFEPKPRCIFDKK